MSICFKIICREVVKEKLNKWYWTLPVSIVVSNNEEGEVFLFIVTPRVSWDRRWDNLREIKIKIIVEGEPSRHKPVTDLLLFQRRMMIVFPSVEMLDWTEFWLLVSLLRQEHCPSSTWAGLVSQSLHCWEIQTVRSNVAPWNLINVAPHYLPPSVVQYTIYWATEHNTQPDCHTLAPPCPVGRHKERRYSRWTV